MSCSQLVSIGNSCLSLDQGFYIEDGGAVNDG
jgi:hypothetical protein